MSIVVQKYGGSSVATPEKIRRVAERIARTRQEGHRVVVVVSAMGDTTDELLALARRVTQRPDRRELDMLLTAGERISMALLSMALNDLGVDAISFTGSQSGIITNDSHANARIVEVRPYRIQDELDRGKVVIVAGYQGVSYRREVTTLGRGGSDTTAVALAAAVGAEWCEICSDVDGVYSADPRIVPQARKLDALTYDEMQSLAEAGARVLNAQAVEFARQKGIALFARATFSDTPGTVIRLDAPTPPGEVQAVASEKEVALVTVPCDATGLAALSMTLDTHGIHSRHLLFDGARALLLVSMENAHRLPDAVAALDRLFPGTQLDDDHATVSCVGQAVGATHAKLAAAVERLAREHIAVERVLTHPDRLDLIVARASVQTAVRALHDELIERRAAPRES